MRCSTTALLSVASMFVLSGITLAQPQSYIRPGTNPYNNAPVTPWLNMLRGGNTATNYYLGVLPEFQQRSLNAQYGAQIQMLNQRTGLDDSLETGDLLPTLPGTGHGTQFMNASPYYSLNPYLNTGSGRRPQATRGTGRPATGR